MILNGLRVTLRPLRMNDAPRFVKWLADSSVNKYVVRRNVTLQEERKWIRGLKKTKATERVFAIDTRDGVHIGSVGLHAIHMQDRHATLGILIGDKRFWDKGYGSEATRLMLDYGFRKLNLHRIDLNVYAYNTRAIKVYKRLGFKREGIARDHAWYAGKFHDDWYMGILRREYLKKNSQLTS